MNSPRATALSSGFAAKKTFPSMVGEMPRRQARYVDNFETITLS